MIFITGFIIAFGDAALQVYQERHGEDPEQQTLGEQLKKMRGSLKMVYSERVGRGTIHVLQRFRRELRAQWLRELPTPIISDHFSLLEEEDRASFVDQTYEIYLRALSGEEDQELPSRSPEEPRRTARRASPRPMPTDWSSPCSAGGQYWRASASRTAVAL